MLPLLAIACCEFVTALLGDDDDDDDDDDHPTGDRCTGSITTSLAF